MLYDVKIRTFDAARKTEVHELVTLDAEGGDAAAEAALTIRPGARVVGVQVKGGFGEVGGAALEAEDTPADAEDEDSEPGPSNRELAAMRMMQQRRPVPLAAPHPEAPVFVESDGERASLDDEMDKVDAPPRRPRGRPKGS